MKKLVIFILDRIIGEDKFTVVEEEKGDHITLNITSDKDSVGLIIGKGGQTIKAIQNVLKTRAKLEGKRVFVTVEER